MSDEISRSALKKLSKRIRKGERKDDDIKLIEKYRESKLSLLIDLLVQLNLLLFKNKNFFLITGRSKRTKSIIRKLERSEGSYISRMVDIIGVRIIVDSIEQQNLVTQVISSSFDLKIKDYRSRKEGYRAVHLYLSISDENIEVQIRTLPQQLWSNESESLGEQVKEGGGTEAERNYLTELTLACIDLDNEIIIENELTGIGSYRGALLGKYPRLVECFENAQDDNADFKYYIIVFDCRTNELLRSDVYSEIEAEVAVEDFCRFTRNLSQNDYDVLFLNSTKLKSLQVTHPMYFPIM